MISPENLTIKKFIKNTKNSIWILMLFLVFILGSTYVYNSVIAKTNYTSDMKILINMKNKNHNNVAQSDDLKTNIQLMNTYSEVITSSQMMKKVNEKLQLPQSRLKEIESNLDVTSDNNSLIIKVGYTDNDQELVTKVMETLSKKIRSELPGLFPNIDISMLEKPSAPVRESSLVKYLLDIVVWLILSLSYLLLITLRDQQIDSAEELEKLGINYLGRVKNKLITRW
ncbi:Wzz/FepE/Etk N-terminal domain-containing protein [Lactobacillus sp. YT155]|uniref:YveK family protein n=1 Tax=Lactobacillus sp. YT155 TaxID=3060955 RepID=UPI00265FC735|nr:Wzz/FepE/Etk N-terminal domain-containing protein [Lactobacillus sp. YT155]MDO1604834.1 Wzz/FepE/Etk N-terminal domain-containing protein [Lactobacillus sp. YT155]